MVWVFAAVIVAVIAVGYLAADARFGEQSTPYQDDQLLNIADLNQITSQDLRQAQFSVVTRGYSMAQVDQLLDRLATQLAAAENTSQVAPNLADRPASTEQMRDNEK